MAEMVLSGRLLDLILVLLILEAIALAVVARRRGAWPSLNGPHLAVLWPTLLSGALLMLTVRLALSDAHWLVLASLLGVAGLVHVVDIAQRIRLAR